MSVFAFAAAGVIRAGECSDIDAGQDGEASQHQADADRLVIEPGRETRVTNGMITNPYEARDAAQ